MGYQRRFDITHDADPKTLAQMVTWLESRHNGPWKAEYLTGEAESPMTWYEFEEEMLELSRLFPEVLLTIEITGEEEPGALDQVRMWVRNGKEITHHPKLVWPDSPDVETVLPAKKAEK